MLSLNFEQIGVDSVDLELESKFKHIDTLFTAMEHLVSSSEHFYAGNRTASLKSYLEAYYTLNFNGLNVESYGLDKRCLDDRTFTMEAYNVAAILDKVIAAIIAILMFAIMFVKKSSSSSNSSFKLSHYFNKFWDVDSGNKLITKLKHTESFTSQTSKHLVDGCKEMVRVADTVFTSTGKLLKAIIESNNKAEIEEEAARYDREVTAAGEALKNSSDRNTPRSGLYVIGNKHVTGVISGLIYIGKDLRLNESEIRALSEDYIRKYHDRLRNLDSDSDQSERLLRVNFDTSGEKISLSSSEYDEISKIMTNINSAISHMQKECSVYYEQMKTRVEECKKVSDRAKMANIENVENVREAVNGLKLMTTILHGGVVTMTNFSRSFG